MSVCEISFLAQFANLCCLVCLVVFLLCFVFIQSTSVSVTLWLKLSMNIFPLYLTTILLMKTE